MDNNRAAITRELILILVVVALLLTAAGFLVRNVIVAVRSLDGAPAAQESFSLDDLDKAVRDLAARIPGGKKNPAPAPAPAPAAPPAARPQPPAAETQKSAVTSVRFFEAGKDIPQPKARQYAVKFDRQARNILVEIAYKNSSYNIADATIPLEIRCLGPAGQAVGELKTTARPKKEWATAVYSNILAAAPAGGWPAGQYTVTVFFDGDYIGDYKFAIE